MKNEININIEKAMNLLAESMSEYSLGNNTTAYKKYQEAGNFLAEADRHLNTDEGKASLLYGTNNNFGVAYKVFESNTGVMINNPEKRKQLLNIINTIKENKVLSDEFATYNAFTNPINVNDAESYVSESIDLINHYTPKTLKENNEKLIKLIKDYNLNENITMTDDEQEVYENIEYMITNKKSFSNINEYANIKKNLVGYVNENNITVKEKVDLDKLYESMVKNITDKYTDLLNEDEFKLINDVMVDEQKARKMFAENKERVIELIKNDNDSQWNELLEQIEKKNFNKDTALTDIAELMEVRNTLEKD